MIPSNFVQIPKSLFFRMLAAIETPLDLNERELEELIEDAQQWHPHEYPDDAIEVDTRGRMKEQGGGEHAAQHRGST